jgi:hypothetical protein
VSWDVFLSHASEDKDLVVRPLADALTAEGWKVWYDEFELIVGDSLNRSINAGLAACDFGVVVLSPHFFAKEWPQRELDGLTAREIGIDGKVILPVWHDLSHAEVARHSPTLADRFAVSTSEGAEAVAHKLSEAIRRTKPPQPPQVTEEATVSSVRGGLQPESLLAPMGPILALADAQPDAALGALAQELDVEIRDLASAAGHEAVTQASTEEVLAWIVEHGIVGRGLASNYGLLTGSTKQRFAPGQLRGVIDGLCGLLQVLLVSPSHGYEVAAANVPIYRDPACREPYAGVTAVVLWELGSHLQRRQHRIYPSRQRYWSGQLLGWQWSSASGWDDAWWKDDFESGQIRLAWSAALEFVGQPLLRQLRT